MVSSSMMMGKGGRRFREDRKKDDGPVVPVPYQSSRENGVDLRLGTLLQPRLTLQSLGCAGWPGAVLVCQVCAALPDGA